MTDYEVRMGALNLLLDSVPVKRATKREDASQLITDQRHYLKQGDATAHQMFGNLSRENAERVLNEMENQLYYVCDGRALPPLLPDDLVDGRNSDRSSAS